MGDAQDVLRLTGKLLQLTKNGPYSLEKQPKNAPHLQEQQLSAGVIYAGYQLGVVNKGCLGFHGVGG